MTACTLPAMQLPLLAALAAVTGCTPDKPVASDTPAETGTPADTATESVPPGDSADAPDILINEVCATNTSVLVDAEGLYPDWIELFDASGAGADLAGWSLVDGDHAFVFPEGTGLDPGGYLLVWATGVEGPLQAPFRLSADGESLTLLDAGGEVQDEVRWGRQRQDRSWGRGPNDAWYTYALPTPGGPNDTPPTAPAPSPSLPGGYVAGPASLSLTSARPGAVIRTTTDGSIPGEDSDVYAGPLPIGPVAEAVARLGESGVWTFADDPGLLTRHDGVDANFAYTIADGTATVTMTREAAVQRLYIPLPGGPYGNADTYRVRTRFRVISGSSASVELGFFRSDGDNVAGGELAALDWYGSAHGVAGYIGPAYAAGEGWTVGPSVWYVAELAGSPSDRDFTVTLYAEDGVTVLDTASVGTAGLGEGIDVFGFANEDRSASPNTETVEFDWITWAVNDVLPEDPAATVPPTRVVRARVWAEGWDPSDVYTGVFLEGEAGPLPTAALVATPDDLWSPETGIYANPDGTGQEWERPATLVWIEGGVEVWQREVGLRIHGNGGRSSVKKSFRVYVDPMYGGSTVDAAVFPGRDDTAYTTLVLISGSNDSSTAPQGSRYADVWTLIRDAVATDLYQGVAPIAIAPPRAVRVSLVGEPWGLYALKERVDGDFMARHVGWDDVDLIQNLEVVKEGDDVEWASTWSLFASGDLADPDVWADAQARMDLPWLATYGLFNGWASNHDWPFNNSYCVRPRVADGVWWWVPWDTDAAMGTDATKPFDYDGVALLRTLLPLQAALDRGAPDYDDVYAERWLVLRNLTLRPDLVSAVIDARAAEIRDDLTFETDTWGSDPATWEANIQRMHDYAEARDDYFSQQVHAQLRAGDDVAVTVDGSAGGTILLAERAIPTLPWTLRWYADQPVTLTAVPADGYTFVRWEGVDDESSTVSFVAATDVTVRAVFEAAP